MLVIVYKIITILEKRVELLLLTTFVITSLKKKIETTHASFKAILLYI